MQFFSLIHSLYRAKLMSPDFFFRRNTAQQKKKLNLFLIQLVKLGNGHIAQYPGVISIMVDLHASI